MPCVICQHAVTYKGIIVWMRDGINSTVMMIFCFCLPSLARTLTVLTVAHPVEGVSLTITLPHLLLCDIFLSLHLHYVPDPLFEFYLSVSRTLIVIFPPRFALPTLYFSFPSSISPFSLLSLPPRVLFDAFLTPYLPLSSDHSWHYFAHIPLLPTFLTHPTQHHTTLKLTLHYTQPSQPVTSCTACLTRTSWGTPCCSFSPTSRICPTRWVRQRWPTS